MADGAVASASVRTRRSLTVALPLLIDKFDTKQNDLFNKISSDVATIMMPAELLQLSKSTKLVLQECVELADELYDRNIGNGCPSLAHNILKDKMKLMRSTKQFVKIINLRLHELGECSVSNIDVQSETEPVVDRQNVDEAAAGFSGYHTATGNLFGMGSSADWGGYDVPGVAATDVLPGVSTTSVMSSMSLSVPLSMSSSVSMTGAAKHFGAHLTSGAEFHSTSQPHFPSSTSSFMNGTQPYSVGFQALGAGRVEVSSLVSQSYVAPQVSYTSVNQTAGGGVTFSLPPCHATSNHHSIPFVSPQLAQSQAQRFGAPDPATLHLLRQELFKAPCNPFMGDPSRFHVWASLLQRRMQDIPLHPLDKLNVLMVNTAGKPQELVESFMAAGVGDPQGTFNRAWEALSRRFGSPIQVCHTLRKKLDAFPCIKPPNVKDKLQELVFLCQSIEANMGANSELIIFNLASGQQTVWIKFPEWLQLAWRKYGHQYTMLNVGQHPPFATLVGFIGDKLDEMSNPNFERPVTEASKTKFSKSSDQRFARSVAALKTNEDSNPVSCVFHNKEGHTLLDCKTFAKLPYPERKKFVKSAGLCFRCLGRHFSRLCKSDTSCGKCSGNHCTLMHQDRFGRSDERSYDHNSNRQCTQNGEQTVDSGEDGSASSESQAFCTAACGSTTGTRSCSKTVLTEISHSSSKKKLVCYTIIDEQSNSSFVDPSVMDILGISGPKTDYTLTTLSGLKCKSAGYLVDGLQIRGINCNKSLKLPTLLTSESIPDCKQEVASPSVVELHPHIAHLSRHFPEVDPVAEVLLLLGRDCGDVMRTKCHGEHFPFAHETPLGWALVGAVCPLASGEKCVLKINHEHVACHQDLARLPKLVRPAELFAISPDDDLPGLSKNEQRFLDMEKNVCVSSSGRITMPLPSKHDTVNLPENKMAVYHRTKNTLSRLRKQPQMFEQCVEKMKESVQAAHVEHLYEESTTNFKKGKAWWLPIFPVVHPKKLKARLVFDSSAEYSRISLNSCLLVGPDDINRLRGVLLRFRLGTIGFTADIQSMFYNFGLADEHKDFTRFFWYKDCDPQYGLVQYRGCVHLFGNRPSPAVANYGLNYAIDWSDSNASSAAKRFVKDNFYVDDGLGCANSVNEAFDMLSGAIEALKVFGIRLHKISSNSGELLQRFPESELSDASRLDITSVPVESTLGISWNLTDDNLCVNSSLPDKPFTKRGILSTVHSLYDPLGVIGPVTLGGRLIQRRLMAAGSGESVGWDDPLPEQFLDEWSSWRASVNALSDLKLARSHVPRNFGVIKRTELHAFADASDLAMGAVIYLRLINGNSDTHVSYVISTSKLIPRAATTIPRAELCACLEACHLSSEVQRELMTLIDQVYFYSDSKVVLGYIKNDVKRFSNYVTNRICSILRMLTVAQWSYVSSGLNLADTVSRPQDLNSLKSTWLVGPDFLWDYKLDLLLGAQEQSEDVELPDTLKEATVMAVESNSYSVPGTILQSVSSWVRAARVMATCLAVARRIDAVRQKLGMSLGPRSRSVSTHEGQLFLLSRSQEESYGSSIAHLLSDAPESLPVCNSIASLDPFVDSEGLLRVGGRLENAWMSFEVKHPVILSHKHPISSLIILHYHQKIFHQGRHLTVGAIRDAGFYIHRGSKLIKKLLYNCVTCRRLRAHPIQQKMADLPLQRVCESPPFLHSGVDVFGPFSIACGKATRRAVGSVKMWALLLTCMMSRAVHVEPLYGLDISSLRNALRRFVSVRGHCQHFYSDRGTNFVGVSHQNEIMSCLTELEKEAERDNVFWHFNAPLASHHGGVWERKIGSIRRALDLALFNLRGRLPTVDEFTTFLSEASNVVNNTPLWEVSSDPKDPIPLSPAMLITLRDKSCSAPLHSFDSKSIMAYGRFRWKRVQYLADCFWREWQKYYLHSLQERRKWTKPGYNLQEGDVVLLRSKQEKRNHWPVARVQAVKRGSDGLVRSAVVEVGSGKAYTRPVSELVLLVSR